MSTSSDVAPTRRTTSSASESEAGDEVRYGIWHTQQAIRPDRLGRQVRHERRIDPAGQPEHRLVETGLAQLAADELADDPPRDVRVDRELGRQFERGRQRGHRAGLLPEADRVRRPIARGDVEAGLGTGITRRVPGQTGPFGHDPRQLADLELGALVAQQRQPDPLAPDVGGGDIDREQALVVERRGEQGGAIGADDLRAAPERDRFVDPDAVAEDHEGRGQLGVCAHEPAPRRRGPEPDLVRGGQVASWRRRHVDQDLGAVEGEELGHRQVPEVLADREPDAHPESGRHRTQHVAVGEEPPLVEQAVRRQEDLAVDVADLAVLEQGRGDEQPVVGRLLDERHDRGQVAGRSGEVGQARIVEAHRDLGREVLELVARQAELGEDDEVRALGASVGEELVVTGKVGIELAQRRGDLREGDPHGLHAPEHTRTRC